jgi:hypothetical protein
MEKLGSLLWGAWEWVQALAPTSEAAERQRTRVRLQLEEERAKPAGLRNKERLLALLKEDNRLNLALYGEGVAPRCRLPSVATAPAAAMRRRRLVAPPAPSPRPRCTARALPRES